MRTSLVAGHRLVLASKTFSIWPQELQSKFDVPHSAYSPVLLYRPIAAKSQLLFFFFFFFLRPAPVSGRVGVPVPTPRSLTSESSLVIVVSVLGVVILLVFAPIVVIIIVLSKGRCAASQLNTRYTYVNANNRKAQTGI